MLISWCHFYEWHCIFALCNISSNWGVVSFAYNIWFGVLLSYQVCVQRVGKGSRVSRTEMEHAGMQGATTETKRFSGKLLQLSSAFCDSKRTMVCPGAGPGRYQCNANRRSSTSRNFWFRPFILNLLSKSLVLSLFLFMSRWCCAPASCVILGWLCRPVSAYHDTLVPLASVLFSRIALGLALALCPDWICLLDFHFFPISFFSPFQSSCLSSGVWLCKLFCPGGPLCGWATPHFQIAFKHKREIGDVFRFAPFLPFHFFFPLKTDF